MTEETYEAYLDTDIANSSKQLEEKLKKSIRIVQTIRSCSQKV